MGLVVMMIMTATHCNALQHSATHCSALQTSTTKSVMPVVMITTYVILSLAESAGGEATSCHTL